MESASHSVGNVIVVVVVVVAAAAAAVAAAQELRRDLAVGCLK